MFLSHSPDCVSCHMEMAPRTSGRRKASLKSASPTTFSNLRPTSPWPGSFFFVNTNKGRTKKHSFLGNYPEYGVRGPGTLNLFVIFWWPLFLALKNDFGEKCQKISQMFWRGRGWSPVKENFLKKVFIVLPKDDRDSDKSCSIRIFRGGKWPFRCLVGRKTWRDFKNNNCKMHYY